MTKRSALWLTLWLFSLVALAEQPKAGYVSLKIDNLMVETQGVEAALNRLASAIEEISMTINNLDDKGVTLTPEDRETLSAATSSLEKAALSIDNLANQMPLTVDKIARELPKISAGVESASKGVIAITESLPQATENARKLVNSVTDSILIRVTAFSIGIILVFFVLVAIVLFYLYRFYVRPLNTNLEKLAAMPEQLAAIAGHMETTSNNLLELQRHSGQAGKKRKPMASGYRWPKRH